MKKNKEKKKTIIPIKDKCVECGEKVKNHHFLCDKCWGKKERKKYWKQKVKIQRNNHKVFYVNKMEIKK
jgi:hypothetical protein